MVRGIAVYLVFVALVFVSGCGTPGQQTANNDDWFRKNNEAFERQHAEHVKQSSKAVQDYRRYRNR